MRNYPAFRLLLLLLAAMLVALTGCTALPALTLPTSTLPPTPAPTLTPAETMAPTPPPTQPAVQDPGPTPPDTAGPITDPAVFKTALLQAMMDQDAQKLEGWMSHDFLTGGWRADGSFTSPADALRELYSYYLGTENQLELVENVDLKTLMGGYDPLTMGRADAGIIEAFLVSGWGKDSRDEAVLLIARQPDNSLKWYGWMTIQGGFSGARLGGSQPYSNPAYGYSLFLPKDSQIEEASADHVLVMAPGEGHPGQGRAAAFIDVEPAGGRSVEEITEKIKADLGPGFDIPPGTAMGLDKAMAIVLTGIPGQDVNRQLFVVYNDLLYHITFVPDTPQAGKPYWQMEDLYAMIVNTFHFTN